jgi:hypothetical protein
MRHVERRTDLTRTGQNSSGLLRKFDARTKFVSMSGNNTNVITIKDCLTSELVYPFG